MLSFTEDMEPDERRAVGAHRICIHTQGEGPEFNLLEVNWYGLLLVSSRAVWDPGSLAWSRIRDE
eukprot:5869976-Heterocapsa_arctica.AAC.1